MFRLEDICLEKALLSPESKTRIGKTTTRTQQGVYVSLWHNTTKPVCSDSCIRFIIFDLTFKKVVISIWSLLLVMFLLLLSVFKNMFYSKWIRWVRRLRHRNCQLKARLGHRVNSAPARLWNEILPQK